MPRQRLRITVDNLMHTARYLDGRLVALPFCQDPFPLKNQRRVCTTGATCSHDGLLLVKS